FDAIGADEVREPPVVARRRRAGRLAGRGLAADRQPVAVRDDLRRHRRHVGHREADVVERRAARRARRLAFVQQQIHVGEFDRVDVADLDGLAAERVDPEPLVVGDARHVQVIVADDDGRREILQLRRRRARERRERRACDPRAPVLFDHCISPVREPDLILSAPSSGVPMSKMIRAALALAASGCFALPAFAQDLVVSNARILVGDGNALERGTVVVRAGRIASVGANATGAPANAVRIDAGGRTVMPGFIDAHRHIIQGDAARWLADQSAANMREFLEAGFTTVLSAIDPPEQILVLRRRTETAETLGPRIISAALVPLSRAPLGTGAGDPARTDPARLPNRPVGPPAPAIPPEETLAAVRASAARGHDAIKTLIIVTMDGPEKATLKLIADEAARLGLLSITHAVSVIDTVAAVEAGTDILVHTPHIGQLDEATAKKIAAANL